MNKICYHPDCTVDLITTNTIMDSLGPAGNMSRPWFCSGSCKTDYVENHLEVECPACGEACKHTTTCPDCGFDYDRHRTQPLGLYQQYDDDQCQNCGLAFTPKGPGQQMAHYTDPAGNIHRFCSLECGARFKDKNDLP